MYVLKLVDQSARQKAIILKRKSNSMERLLEELKEFVEEKNGMVQRREKGNENI